jgi:hypothetical protein
VTLANVTDDPSEGMFTPEVLGPTMDRLAPPAEAQTKIILAICSV